VTLRMSDEVTLRMSDEVTSGFNLRRASVPPTF